MLPLQPPSAEAALASSEVMRKFNALSPIPNVLTEAGNQTRVDFKSIFEDVIQPRGEIVDLLVARRQEIADNQTKARLRNFELPEENQAAARTLLELIALYNHGRVDNLPPAVRTVTLESGEKAELDFVSMFGGLLLGQTDVTKPQIEVNPGQSLAVELQHLLPEEKRLKDPGILTKEGLTMDDVGQLVVFANKTLSVIEEAARVLSRTPGHRLADPTLRQELAVAMINFISLRGSVHYDKLFPNQQHLETQILPAIRHQQLGEEMMRVVGERPTETEAQTARLKEKRPITEYIDEGGVLKSTTQLEELRLVLTDHIPYDPQHPILRQLLDGTVSRDDIRILATSTNEAIIILTDIRGQIDKKNIYIIDQYKDLYYYRLPSDVEISASPRVVTKKPKNDKVLVATLEINELGQEKEKEYEYISSQVSLMVDSLGRTGIIAGNDCGRIMREDTQYEILPDGRIQYTTSDGQKERLIYIMKGLNKPGLWIREEKSLRAPGTLSEEEIRRIVLREASRIHMSRTAWSMEIEEGFQPFYHPTAVADNLEEFQTAYESIHGKGFCNKIQSKYFYTIIQSITSDDIEKEIDEGRKAELRARNEILWKLRQELKIE